MSASNSTMPVNGLLGSRKIYHNPGYDAYNNRIYEIQHTQTRTINSPRINEPYRKQIVLGESGSNVNATVKNIELNSSWAGSTNQNQNGMPVVCATGGLPTNRSISTFNLDNQALYSSTHSKIPQRHVDISFFRRRRFTGSQSARQLRGHLYKDNIYIDNYDFE